MSIRRGWLVLTIFLVITSLPARGAAPVWKVTDGKGGTLYLGGSIHALRRSDYPLPTAFDQAFDKSERVVIEDEPDTKTAEKIYAGGEYPHGDSLKKHVDPRTYAYVVKVFGLMGVPEAKVARYRPWLLTLMLMSPSNDFGIEGQFVKKARAQHKPVSGLVGEAEHLGVFTGLSDRQSEGVLLLTFIPQKNTVSFGELVKAWKRGEADQLWRQVHANYVDYPYFGERLLEARNRTWMPKIEGFLRSGHTYFVIAGMAHMGGPEGLPTLLRQRGYQVEQL